MNFKNSLQIKQINNLFKYISFPFLKQQKHKQSTIIKLNTEQEKLLDEKCILVDRNDRVVGSASKKECHLIGHNGEPPPLHRAFSVFLFNSNEELLMQQRSDYKITFPGYYTNTCCSHPLHNSDELELENIMGVRRAAHRRLQIELGIPSEQINPMDFVYLTRVLYESPSQGEWGEHELDYILFYKGDVTIKPNPNEIKQLTYVSQTTLHTFLKELEQKNVPISPWFRLILNKFLPTWWKNLHCIHDYIDHDTIHYFDK